MSYGVNINLDGYIYVIKAKQGSLSIGDDVVEDEYN